VDVITIRYPDEHDFLIVYKWCQDNCRGKFYSGTDWDIQRWQSDNQNRIYQFDSEEDAALFVLRWS
jgi:hypothetical protein